MNMVTEAAITNSRKGTEDSSGDTGASVWLSGCSSDSWGVRGMWMRHPPKMHVVLETEP